MKRIEMLTDVRDAPGYIKSEIRIVSDEVAEYFCGLGWAKDLDGVVATGSPSTAEVTLEVQNGHHGHAATTVGV